MVRRKKTVPFSDSEEVLGKEVEMEPKQVTTRRKKRVGFDSEPANDIFKSEDQLPGYVPYIDVVHTIRKGSESRYRAFFEKPTRELLEDTVDLKKAETRELPFLTVGIGPIFTADGDLAENVKSGKFDVPTLVDQVLGLGFSMNFAKNICQLLIHEIRNKSISSNSFSAQKREVVKALGYIAEVIQSEGGVKIEEFGLKDLKMKHWLYALPKFNSGTQRSQAKKPFISFGPTSINGDLRNLLTDQKEYKEEGVKLPEHISEIHLGDSGYTDAEMYQINALTLSFIYLHQEAVERYENIEESALPFPCKLFFNEEELSKIANYLGKDVSDVDLTPDIYGKINEKLGVNPNFKLSAAISSAHADIDKFENCLDMQLYWKKTTGKSLFETYSVYGNSQNRENLSKWVNRVVPQGTATRKTSWVEYYTGKDATKTSRFNCIHGWCISNLIRIVSGKNKEVTTSIPSRTLGGRSILDRESLSYKDKNNESKEVELYGFKNRNAKGEEVEYIRITKDKEIFQILKWYEQHIKSDFDGPFLEFPNKNISFWTSATITPEKVKGVRGKPVIPEFFQFFDKDGNRHTLWYAERFRKVFASQKFLQLLKETDDPRMLIQKFKNALVHKEFDTTFSHYLMKTSAGRTAVDSAIVAITETKLEEGLKFEGVIEVKKSRKPRKKVFLCECDDPFNPSHDVYVAQECKHYDLCLGCNKSVVVKENLPFICKRILQYEDYRNQYGKDWAIMFEDKYMIALDALEKYQEADSDGEKNIEEAWKIAKSSQIYMPPLLDAGI